MKKIKEFLGQWREAISEEDDKGLKVLTILFFPLIPILYFLCVKFKKFIDFDIEQKYLKPQIVAVAWSLPIILILWFAADKHTPQFMAAWSGLVLIWYGSAKFNYTSELRSQAILLNASIQLMSIDEEQKKRVSEIVESFKEDRNEREKRYEREKDGYFRGKSRQEFIEAKYRYEITKNLYERVMRDSANGWYEAALNYERLRKKAGLKRGVPIFVVLEEPTKGYQSQLDDKDCEPDK
jgi:hypothetical protein